MKKYETIVILKPDSPEDYVSTLVKKVEKAITTKPGEMIKKLDWGVKRLAYEIEHQKQGRYLFWSYTQTPKGLLEIDKKLRFEENILRFVTIVATEEKAAPKSEKKDMPNPKSRRVGTNGGGGERLYSVDYKEPAFLSKYITERGKIIPRHISGIDAVSQRKIAVAIKRARQLALLSYTEGFFSSGEQQPAPGGQP